MLRSLFVLKSLLLISSFSISAFADAQYYSDQYDPLPVRVPLTCVFTFKPKSSTEILDKYLENYDHAVSSERNIDRFLQKISHEIYNINRQLKSYFSAGAPEARAILNRFKIDPEKNLNFYNGRDPQVLKAQELIWTRIFLKKLSLELELEREQLKALYNLYSRDRLGPPIRFTSQEVMQQIYENLHPELKFELQKDNIPMRKHLLGKREIQRTEFGKKESSKMEALVAEHIVNTWGGVLGFNMHFHNENLKQYYEIDIVMKNVFIEVTLQKSGKKDQILSRYFSDDTNPNKVPVILYAENYETEEALKILRECNAHHYSCFLARSTNELDYYLGRIFE